MYRRLLWTIVLSGLAAGTGRPAASNDEALAVEVGRQIFLDTTLSHPTGQGCISCHLPHSAFSDPRPVSPGAVPGRSSQRNAPSLMYAATIRSLAQEETPADDFVWEGGLTWDGRARDLFEQIQLPIFNPDEMNLSGPEEFARKLRQSEYAKALRRLTGDAGWNDDDRLNYQAFRALVAFLKEPLFRPFDARIDDFLRGDPTALNEAEKRGLKVFREKGKCADCHLLDRLTWPETLLSDFGYDNLGAPSRGEKDPGLYATTRDAEDTGKFRAPTLRNIALTAPYFHNGSIASLREVMEFYNQRDLEPDRWGPTDYPETVNHDDLGNLKLSEEEIEDLLALMQAFTDRSLLRMTEKGEAFPQAVPPSPEAAKTRLWISDWTHRGHPGYIRPAD